MSIYNKCLPDYLTLLTCGSVLDYKHSLIPKVHKMFWRPYQSILTLCVVLVFCNGNSHPDVRVTGTWEARFSGKVQDKGTSQDDTLVMELTQDGSTVKGTLHFKGLETSFPIKGKVKGKTFSYSAKASMGPNCDAIVVAETTVDDAADRFEGSQTQSNCEGTAVGRVTAVRQ